MKETGMGKSHRAGAVLVFLLLMTCASRAGAQELVAAAYTPAPYGINLVTVSSTYNAGDLAFDPSAPIEEATAEIGTSMLGYARTINLAGRSSNIGVVVPYIVGNLEGLYLGEPASARRAGLGDIGIRFAVNLFGTPAMNPREFQAFRPKTLVGMSLTISAPTGQYDSSKLINIGTNRWGVKPEVGVVRVMGRWAVDFYVGAVFFTDNTDFFGGITREQEPILNSQVHLRRAFSPRIWAAVDANFWRGGQTTLDGTISDDRQQNSRVGLTVAWSMAPRHAMRFAASVGAITRIGGDFNSIGVSYNYSWTRHP
jgi:hypothetical protein